MIFHPANLVNPVYLYCPDFLKFHQITNIAVVTHKWGAVLPAETRAAAVAIQRLPPPNRQRPFIDNPDRSDLPIN